MTTPPGFRQLLEAGGDVYTLAMSVLTLDDHIAEIDADADAHTFSLGKRTVALLHPPLNGDSALNRIDDTYELRQKAIARQLEDAAPVLLNRRLEDFLPVSLQPRERSGLVALHQRRIAGDVGDQNGGKASFHGHLPLVCLIEG